MECVTVDFQTKLVKPKTAVEIPIYFHPTEITEYHNFIPFLVNSKIYTIAVHGEGVPLRLNLFDPSERFIDLGSTITGKTTTKPVKVINNSSITIDVKFDIWNRLPYYQKKTKTLEPEYDLPQQQHHIIYEEKPQAKGDVKIKKKGHRKESDTKSIKRDAKTSKKGSRKGRKTETASSVSSKSDKKGKKEKNKAKQTDQQ